MRNHRPASTVWARICGLSLVPLFATACLVGLHAGDGEPPSPRQAGPVLHLANGGFALGTMQDSARPGTLRWQAPHFDDAFEFAIDAVSSIQVPGNAAPPRPEGAFRFEMAGGDLVFGDLVALDDDAAVLDLPRFGRLRVKRAHLHRIDRWRDRSDLIYLGPNGLAEWKPSPADQPRAWSDESGELSTAQEGASIFGDLRLPPRAVFEFELSWKGKPDFMIALGVNDDPKASGRAFRFEVWENDLVVHRETEQEADVAPVGAIKPGAGRAHLRAFLDQERGRIVVASPDGKTLADLHVAERNPRVLTGVRIENRRGDVKLERLEVSRWNGESPREAGTERPPILRGDGTSLTGQVTGYDADAKAFVIRDGEKETRVPRDEIAHVILSTPAEIPTRTVLAIFQDGSRLSGHLSKVEGGALWLTTADDDEPARASLDGLRALLVLRDKGAKPNRPNSSARLEAEGVRLTGRLVDGPARRGASCLAWQPDGSNTASPLRAGTSGRIIYKEPPPSRVTPRSTQTLTSDRGLVFEFNGAPMAPAAPERDAFKAEVAVKAAAAVAPAPAPSPPLPPPPAPAPPARGEVPKAPAPAPPVVVGEGGNATFTITYVPIAVDAPQKKAAEKAEAVAKGAAVIAPAPAPAPPAPPAPAPAIRAVSANAQFEINFVPIAAAPPQEQAAVKGEIVARGAVVAPAPAPAPPGPPAPAIRAVVPAEPPPPPPPPGGVMVFEGAAGEFRKPGSQVSTRRTATPKRRSLYLRTGDVIPAEVVKIDEDGVTIRSPLSESTFVPHDKIKAVELADESALTVRLNQAKRDRLLTLPRVQKGSPPTHLIRSTNGDYLRGRVVQMDDKTLQVEVRLETREVPRERVSRIIWLHAEEADAPKPGSGTDTTQLVQAVRSDGVRLTFAPEQCDGSTITGKSDVLGECRIRLDEVDQLLIGGAIAHEATQLAYQRWKLTDAPEPKVAQGDGASPDGRAPGFDSNLVGKPAPDFELELLGANGKRFRLADSKGRVVVLDFWATWCGPCLQAMPQVERVADEFRDQGVQLVAVNLQEAPRDISAMLDRHKLKLTVALDKDGVVAEKYAANAIPQTVVIDKDGNVARLFVGGGPNLGDQLRDALKAVLTPPASDAKPASQ